MTEQDLEQVLNQLPTGLMMLDQNHAIIYMNSIIASKFNLDQSSTPNVCELFAKPNSYDNFKISLKALRHLELYETEVIFKTSKGITVPVNLSVRKSSDSQILLCVQDISGQKAYERVIESSFDNFVKTTTDLDEAIKKIKQQHHILQDYKKKMLRELQIAEKVQNALVPVERLRAKGCTIFGLSCPSAQVGGDFFDYFLINENLCAIFFADVSGHGVPSALITAMLKALFAEGVTHSHDPGEILTFMNNIITKNLAGSGFFLTAQCIILDLENSTLNMANAGHDYPLKLAEGKCTELGTNSGQTIIGSFPDIQYKTDKFAMQRNDLIVLYTDGITEARNPGGEFFTRQNLVKLLNKHREDPLEDIASFVMHATEQFAGTGACADDRTILCIRKAD